LSEETTITGQNESEREQGRMKNVRVEAEPWEEGGIHKEMGRNTH
jgi:hypothetical protein